MIFIQNKYLLVYLDKTIMMIEADVVMGRLFGENDSIAERPIMGHPPVTKSDITLQGFLESILEVCTTGSKLPKSVKLSKITVVKHM